MRWGAELLALNPGAQVTMEEVGASKHRLVLIDDFYKHPEDVAALADGAHFLVDPAANGNYPGGRAYFFLETQPLIDVLSNVWGSPLQAVGGYQPFVLSALENAGQPLNNAQRQPHIDPGVSSMVYLNRPQDCAGGTGVYRHRLTGLERIPVQPTPEIVALAQRCDLPLEQLTNEAGYKAFQDSVVFNPLFAAAGGEYINDGNDYWELVYLIEMKFNRLVVFDGRLPHSQYLKPGQLEGVTRLNQILYLTPQA